MRVWVLPLSGVLQMNEDDGYQEPGGTEWRTAEWGQGRFADRLNETVVVLEEDNQMKVCPIEDTGRVGPAFLLGAENWLVDIVDF